MGAYKPIKITGLQTGLIEGREDFLLPNDGFPVLENAYVWRERIVRKYGTKLIGRLRRLFSARSYFLTSGSPWTFNVRTLSGYVSNINTGVPAAVVITTKQPHGLSAGDKVVFSGIVGTTQLNGDGPPALVVLAVPAPTPTTFAVDSTVAPGRGALGAYTSGGFFYSNRLITTSEPRAQIEPGSVVIVSGGVTFTDNGLGVLTGSAAGNSGTINYLTGAVTLTHTLGAGVATTLAMAYFPGLPVMGIREKETDTINAEDYITFDTKYAYRNTGTGYVEYLPGTTWTGGNDDFFWSTNYWVDSSNRKLFWVTNFSGVSGDPIRYTEGVTWTDFTPQVDAGPNYMYQALMLFPFRGRLIALNTYEGATFAGSLNKPNRIRWAEIGEPRYSVVATAWRDDVPGKGGWLDIPTSEHIVAAGFVRDNLVIYCERSTWQLRHTGMSIAPFQIERVNTELGAEGTYSAVNFDASIFGIGNKGIVECDSYNSKRVDIKIPDFIFDINNLNSGPQRVHGIRDQYAKLCYWTYPLGENAGTFPDHVLVYNYENDSWATYTDSFTCFGEHQDSDDLTWAQATDPWFTYERPWSFKEAEFPWIAGGNQQGFVSKLNAFDGNDVSLSIAAIIPSTATDSTRLTVYDHNLIDGQIIYITGILATSGYALPLNNKAFSVAWVDANTIEIFSYSNGLWNTWVTTTASTYIGGAYIAVRDNFIVRSKKFGHLDEAQKIQIGFVDVLANQTPSGAMTMNVYTDYRNSNPNQSLTVSTAQTNYSQNDQQKAWHRIFCQNRANFVQLEWTLSNAQMNSSQQPQEVEIDAVILYERTAGRLTI